MNSEQGKRREKAEHLFNKYYKESKIFLLEM